jgi:hypothetical protein
MLSTIFWQVKTQVIFNIHRMRGKNDTDTRTGVGVRLLGESFKIWIVIVVIIQLTWHIDRNSTELEVWPQGNNKWGLTRSPPRGIWEGFLVLEGSVVVQSQCLGPQKKAYLEKYRMQAFFRVLTFLNWDTECSGGLTELKKHRKPVFGPK